MRYWAVSHSRGGYALNVYEGRRIGKALEWVLDHDAGWWGRYGNIPFCWINPWAWTYRIGPEDHSIGHYWWTVGQRLHQLAYKLTRECRIHSAPLTEAEAEGIEPEFVSDMRAIFDDDE